LRLNQLFTEPFDFCNDPADLMTDMDYPIYPEGIYQALKVVCAYVINCVVRRSRWTSHPVLV